MRQFLLLATLFLAALGFSATYAVAHNVTAGDAGRRMRGLVAAPDTRVLQQFVERR